MNIKLWQVSITPAFEILMTNDYMFNVVYVWKACGEIDSFHGKKVYRMKQETNACIFIASILNNMFIKTHPKHIHTHTLLMTLVLDAGCERIDYVVNKYIFSGES